MGLRLGLQESEVKEKEARGEDSGRGTAEQRSSGQRLFYNWQESLPLCRRGWKGQTPRTLTCLSRPGRAL